MGTRTMEMAEMNFVMSNLTGSVRTALKLNQTNVSVLLDLVVKSAISTLLLMIYLYHEMKLYSLTESMKETYQLALMGH